MQPGQSGSSPAFCFTGEGTSEDTRSPAETVDSEDELASSEDDEIRDIEARTE